MKGYIYKITNPSGNIYIGQTRNPADRFKYYRLGHCKKQTKIYRSIQKYGWENHITEIIETIDYDKEKLNELEKFYIKKYNSFDTSIGLNLTAGGNIGMLPAATRAQIRKLQIGRKTSEETKEKLRIINTGKKQPPEVSAKIWAKTRGKVRTPEQRKRMSEGRKGIIFSESHILAMKNAKRPPVSEETRQKMSAALKGKGNFKPGHTYNSKKVIDISTGQIFESLTVACKEYGLKFHTVKRHLAGKVKSHKTPLKWL